VPLVVRAKMNPLSIHQKRKPREKEILKAMKIPRKKRR
jgi:hypothetical protein